MTTPRWKRRPEGSNWGDYGPDDQNGRLNLLTPQKVLQGVAEVQEGKVFCLSLPLDYPGGNGLNPNRHPPMLRPTLRNGGAVNFNFHLDSSDAGRTDVICDDLAILHLQYSTQWDSLGHVGGMFDADGDGVAEAVYYNGYREGEDLVGPSDPSDCGVPDHLTTHSTSHAKALGIERMAERSVQGRGALVDLKANLGPQRMMVGYDDLMRILDRDKVEIEAGDILCLHTGFAERLLDMKKQPDHGILANVGAVLNGRDSRLLQWISDSNIAAIAADNYAVEGLPSEDGGDCCAALPLHEHCLFKLGLHLGELWRLTPLADWLRQAGRYRFLLTAPPLNLPGAVGSPLTPVATV